LTLKTAVNPESEESSTQFQRTAYSGIPSLFFHLTRFRASITHPPRNLVSSQIVKDHFLCVFKLFGALLNGIHEAILHLEGSLINSRTVSGSWLFCEVPG
jgi:hypothetical protein